MAPHLLFETKFARATPRLALAALLALAACARSAPAPVPPAPRPADVDAADAGRAAVRYLALGDSFTIGTGSSPGQAFPARLAARWSARCAVALRNPAVNGYTTQDVLDRELPEVAPFAPTFVTLAAGANDIVRGRSLDDYRAQVRRLFEALAAAGVPAARVVTLPQPDWSLSPAARSFGDPAAIHAQIVAFNGALREESTRLGARHVDLFPLMEAQARAGLLAPDGLHPDAAAHDAWAAELAARLRDVCDVP
ncbi:MAG: GDSL-type esterase/lipase family protein [Polyangiales bacterium]